MSTLSHLTKLVAQLPSESKAIVVQNGVMNIYCKSFVLRRAVPGYIDGTYNISMVRDANGVATSMALVQSRSPFSLFDVGRSTERFTYPNIEVCKPDLSKARVIGSLTSEECISLSKLLQKSGPEVRERMRHPELGICPAGLVLDEHLIYNARFNMFSIEYFSIGTEVEQLLIELAMYPSVSIIQCPNHYGEYRMMPIMIGAGWENCVMLHVRKDAAFDLNKQIDDNKFDEVPF